MPSVSIPTLRGPIVWPRRRSVASVGNLVSFATDASVSPTTTHVTTTGSQNAVRVWIGNTPVGEADFFLYYRVNGGSAKKKRALRFTGRLLKVGTNASVSFGTADGRTIQACACTLPETRETPTDVSGTANCDAAGPPLWSPTAAHVTLADYNQAFRISHTSEIVVYVSENSGSAWTPPRMVVVPANTPIAVRATYKEIALANYAGTALSVTAPTGATIGGTSAAMTLGIVATGTTYNVAAGNEADFRAKLGLAVAGDEVVLPAGTYTLTAAITATTFAANHGTNIGSSGVIIRGATGNRADVVIKPNTGVDQWLCNNGAGTLPAAVKDLTIDCSGTDSGCRWFGGKWRLQNLRIFGPQTGSQVYPLLQLGPSDTGPQDLLALDVLVEDALDDGVSGIGYISSTHVSTSSIRFVRSISRRSGTTNDNMQCWTTHNGLAIETWGSTGSDARLNVCATGSESGSLFHHFFSTFTPGSRRCGMRDSTYFFCNWTGGNQADDIRMKFGGTAYMIGGVYTNTLLTSTNQITTFLGTASQPQTGRVMAARFVGPGSVGRGIFTITGGAELWFNVLTGLGEGIRNSSYSSGSTGPTLVYNNTLSGCTTAFALSDTTTTLTIVGNATRGSTTGINTTAAQQANTTNSYNVIDPTIDADFVAGTGDVVSGDAAVSTTDWFPTAAGNADDTGSPTVHDWIGGIDIWGFPAIYKAGVSPKGARSLPVIRASQEMYPDFWLG